jgi:hypothetical protein
MPRLYRERRRHAQLANIPDGVLASRFSRAKKSLEKGIYCAKPTDRAKNARLEIPKAAVRISEPFT